MTTPEDAPPAPANEPPSLRTYIPDKPMRPVDTFVCDTCDGAGLAAKTYNEGNVRGSYKEVCQTCLGLRVIFVERMAQP